MYIYIYTHIYIYIYTYVYTHTHTHTQIHIYTYASVIMWGGTLYLCYVYTYTYTYVYIHTYIDTCIHISIRQCVGRYFGSVAWRTFNSYCCHLAWPLLPPWFFLGHICICILERVYFVDSMCVYTRIFSCVYM